MKAVCEYRENNYYIKQNTSNSLSQSNTHTNRIYLKKKLKITEQFVATIYFIAVFHKTFCPSLRDLKVIGKVGIEHLDKYLHIFPFSSLICQHRKGQQI